MGRPDRQRRRAGRTNVTLRSGITTGDLRGGRGQSGGHGPRRRRRAGGGRFRLARRRNDPRAHRLRRAGRDAARRRGRRAQGRRRRPRRDRRAGDRRHGRLERATRASASSAGEGVGTVTKPGLQVPPGEPAINPVPRRMIAAAVREVTPRGVRVEIAIPGGREVARRTFNPRLGIGAACRSSAPPGSCGRIAPGRSASPAMRAGRGGGLRRPAPRARARQHRRQARPGGISRLRRRATDRGRQRLGLRARSAGRAGQSRFDAVLLLGHPGKLAKLALGNGTPTRRGRKAAARIGRPIAPRGLRSGRPPTARPSRASSPPWNQPSEPCWPSDWPATSGGAAEQRLRGRVSPSPSSWWTWPDDVSGTAGDLTPWR